MREIKFRAWLKELDEMVEHSEIIAPFIIEPTESVGGKLKFKKLFRYYLSSAHQSWENELYEDVIFMQFTGIKNIYVGDIISEKWRCEVYQNNDGTFMVKFHNKPALNKSRSLLSYLKGRDLAGCPEDNEVVGNIYANPELLISTGQKNGAKPLL